MPSSFDAMHDETRPLALLDADPGQAQRPRRSHAQARVVWLRLAKASLIVGGGAVLLAVA